MEKSTFDQHAALGAGLENIVILIEQVSRRHTAELQAVCQRYMMEMKEVKERMEGFYKIIYIDPDLVSQVRNLQDDKER